MTIEDRITAASQYSHRVHRRREDRKTARLQRLVLLLAVLDLTGALALVLL